MEQIMDDLKQRILDIIHKPQLAALATVTELNNPWVRYVVTVGDGDFTIRCATFTNSRKVAQIENNPNVHITLGVSNFMDMQPYIQVQGKARVATDHDERHNFWNDLLAPIFKGPDDPKYCIVVTEPYRIEYITPGSFEPEVWVK
jgi:general stress protein 26